MTSSKTEITVLVTGVGAIIGQGIIKSLRKSNYSVRIVGLDKSNRSPAPFLCDKFYQKPLCEESSPDYISFWKKILKRDCIDIVIPGLEVDVFFLDANRSLFHDLGVKIAINKHELISLSTDKWKLNQKLMDMGLIVIPSIITENWSQAISTLGNPPLLLKPRSGNGSRGIVRLYDEKDFEYWRNKSGNNWMLQRIIGNDCSEFTVGIFGYGDGESVSPIILKRRISVAGNTIEAQVNNDEAIVETSKKLTKYFKPIGPTNYQFRKEDNNIFLLEINPRFSSSNSLRTAFGYNEAEMTIDYFIFGKFPQKPSIKEGIAWRYSEDFIKYDSNFI